MFKTMLTLYFRNVISSMYLYLVVWLYSTSACEKLAVSDSRANYEISRSCEKLGIDIAFKFFYNFVTVQLND